MKTLLLTAGIALLSFTSTQSLAHSKVKSVVSADSSADSSLCVAIAKDNPLLILKRLKQAGLRKHQAKDVLRCNGMSASEFAYKHNAFKAIARLDLATDKERYAHNPK
ncbi:DUF3718 domain-containing protein [Pseudoalteromonas sp.]|uniref:DUF3718 domain-containing protein n=1 Tax=Pseudoalteromonas sp. TaxID=53249 RepID=UPI003561C771